MITTRLAMMCAVILMAGCATERWVQDGKTSDDVAAALVRCEQSVPPAPVDAMYPPPRPLPDQSLIVKCMKDQGYRLVSTGETR